MYRFLQNAPPLSFSHGATYHIWRVFKTGSEIHEAWTKTSKYIRYYIYPLIICHVVRTSRDGYVTDTFVTPKSSTCWIYGRQAFINLRVSAIRRVVLSRWGPFGFSIKRGGRKPVEARVTPLTRIDDKKWSRSHDEGETCWLHRVSFLVAKPWKTRSECGLVRKTRLGITQSLFLTKQRSIVT